MIRKTIAAAVAAALLGSVGMAMSAPGGGHGGGMGAGSGIGGSSGIGHTTGIANPSGHIGGTVNSNAPGTIDRDLGRARAAERMPARAGLHTTPVTTKVKPNRVLTSHTTKITPHKVSKRTTTNTRYHSTVKHHPIPKVKNAPDYRASAKP